MVDPSGDEREPIEVLLEEFLNRQRRGETPALTEYLDRHPEMADDIRELFPALVLMHEVDPQAGELVSSPPVQPALEQVGDYRIVREIGRGGMGVVYEAYQVSLGRRVALKMMSRPLLGDEQAQERFRREARAAARLHHTNIVPVFEVGNAGDVCYYAMQLIEGRSLHDVIDELRRLQKHEDTATDATVKGVGSTPAETSAWDGAGPLSKTLRGGPGAAPPNEATLPFSQEPAGCCRFYHSVARIGQQAGQALAYAHARGLVHRDVKPANLLLDIAGVVWVTDFGLAKSEEESLTRTGELLGTLRYMAPERFEDRCDARSDVYALGLTLYELLVLRPAFSAGDRLPLLEQIRQQNPPRPRAVDPQVPRDLETIVLKAMEKDPGRRYSTADELVEDLRRFLADEPIRARRTTWHEHCWRWCRRNPTVATLVLAVILSLLGGTLTALELAIRADASAVQAQADRDLARHKLFESSIAEADAIRMSRRTGQRFRALQHIRDALQEARGLGLTDEDRARARNVAVAALCLPDVEPGLNWSGGSNAEPPAALDPLFRERLRLMQYVKDHLPAPVKWLKIGPLFSPDGRLVVVATDDYVKRFYTAVRVWRLDGPEPVSVLAEGVNVFEDAAAFSADSCQVAFGHNDGRLVVYDTTTMRPLRELPTLAQPAFTLAYHPSLHRLAVAHGYFVDIWDVDAGQRLVTLSHPDYVTAIAWHPRGDRLLTNYETKLQLWDADSGRPLGIPWQDHRVGGIRASFSHAGDRVVTNDWNGGLRLWDAASGQLLHSDHCFIRPAFASDDVTLGINEERTVRVAGGQELRVLTSLGVNGPEPTIYYSVHPNGRLLALRIDNGGGLWDLFTGEKLATLPTPLVVWGGVHFDDTGALWTFGSTGLLRWPVRAVPGASHRLQVGPPEWQADDPGNVDTEGAFSADGHVAAIPLRSDGALLIHCGPPRREVRLGPQFDVRHVALSPDGRWAFTSSHFLDESPETAIWTKCWDARTGTRVANLPSTVDWRTLGGFSLDSRWFHYRANGALRRVPLSVLVEQSSDNDRAAGTAFTLEDRRSEVIRFDGVYSPDRSFRAVTGHGMIHLLEPDGVREIVRLSTAETGDLIPKQFNADGTLLLATGSLTGLLYVFDLYRIRAGLAELDLDWDAPPYPPRNAEYQRPAVDAPLHVELLGAEAAATRPRMAASEIVKAASALAADPFDGEAHFRLGRFLLERGKSEEAYRHLTVALAFRPDLDSAYLSRAQAAKNLRQWDVVAADATTFLKKYPFDRRARLLRAEANQVRGQPGEAAADLTTLLAVYPENGLLYEARADCYQAQEATDQAAADRVKAQHFGANDPFRLNAAAWQRLMAPAGLRDIPPALTWSERAVEREPDNAAYLATLGLAQYRDGAAGRAVVTLQKSLSLGDDKADAVAQFTLVLSHARLGDLARARDCFNRAIRWIAAHPNLDSDAAYDLQLLRDEAEDVLAKR